MRGKVELICVQSHGVSQPPGGARAEAAHDHVRDGVDGLGDDLLRVPVLPPVGRREVPAVRVVRGDDAQAWLLAWTRGEAGDSGDPGPPSLRPIACTSGPPRPHPVPSPERARGWGAYQVVGRDGHGEDFDAQVLGLVHGILQAPTWLLVALQGVPVGDHDQVLVLLQVGAPARGWAAVRPPQPWPPPALLTLLSSPREQRWDPQDWRGGAGGQRPCRETQTQTQLSAGGWRHAGQSVPARRAAVKGDGNKGLWDDDSLAHSGEMHMSPGEGPRSLPARRLPEQGICDHR